MRLDGSKGRSIDYLQENTRLEASTSEDEGPQMVARSTTFPNVDSWCYRGIIGGLLSLWMQDDRSNSMNSSAFS